MEKILHLLMKAASNRFPISTNMSAQSICKHFFARLRLAVLVVGAFTFKIIGENKINIYVAVMKTIGNNTQSEEYKKAEEMHTPYYQSLIKKRKFIASGPQLAEDGSFAGGGIFLLLVSSRKEAEDIMQNDPLVAGGYSEYTIMEFKPLLFNPEYKILLTDKFSGVVHGKSLQPESMAWLPKKIARL